MRHTLTRTLIAGAAVLAVAAIGAPAASAADPDQSPTVVTTTSGGMGEVACGPYASGNDVDPTKATGNKNDGTQYVPTKNGYGKVEGDAWTAGNVPGLTWTISGQTIDITFDSTFDAQAYPISDILVKGGNGYVVCHSEFYYEAGDSLTLSTEAIGLKNKGENAPDISHVSFYPGEAEYRPIEPPTCTTTHIGTVALSLKAGSPVSDTGNWFGQYRYTDTGAPQVAYLYDGNNKKGNKTPVGEIVLQSKDGFVEVSYQMYDGADSTYVVNEVRYNSSSTKYAADFHFAPGQNLDSEPGAVIKVAEVQGGATYFIIHLDVDKVTCS